MPHVDGKLLNPGAVDLTGLRGEGHIFVDFLAVFGGSADEVVGEALHVLVGGVALGERGERGERLGRLRTNGVEVVDRVVVELVTLREEGGVILAVHQFRVFLLPLVEDLGHAVHEGTGLAELRVGNRFAHGLHLEVVDRLGALLLPIVISPDVIKELTIVEVFLAECLHGEGVTLGFKICGIDGPVKLVFQVGMDTGPFRGGLGIERLGERGIVVVDLLVVAVVCEKF